MSVKNKAFAQLSKKKMLATLNPNIRFAHMY